MPYEVVIKGGHVLDPGQGLDGPMDIGITGGRIAAIQPRIPDSDAVRTRREMERLFSGGDSTPENGA